MLAGDARNSEQQIVKRHLITGNQSEQRVDFRNRRALIARTLSGGGFEGDFGGEAEGVQEAEQEIGGDGLGVAVEDGGDAGAGSACEGCDLSVSEAFAADGFDDFRV